MIINSNGRYLRNAFSLFEILTVLAVIGLLIALSTVALSSLSSTGLSTSTRQVADFMNLCRSRAIAEHTVVRFGVVVPPVTGDPDAAYRAYSSWSWNKINRQFEQSSKWHQVTSDIVFATETSALIRQSEYAHFDAASVRGDHFVDLVPGKKFLVDSPNGEVEVRFFEYTAAGRARVPNGEERNIIAVLKPGNRGVNDTPNWAQINVDRLTGRVRVYRP
ncbi:prepilin-type N-terminal cleavage/methylation domain-containing protein [Verrucomicrobiales bacterium]|jgi:prepilin-type N-terminal cleavage/methylation domain-containing protein|nr:prepilin-type N-terminal cleavage/methylation domain-containing protein [Verrucomicrobiales bacterium]MDB4662644.1 prepilin-type N-terminal cleavage/methylation domain-containing protein [Verrucomicrobiales bacterium]